MSECPVGTLAIRFALECRTSVLDRVVVFALRPIDAGASGQGLGQFRLQLQSTLAGNTAFFEPLGIPFVPVVEEAADVSQSRIGQGKARVQRHSMFVHLRGVFQIRPGAPPSVAASPQVIVISLRVFSGLTPNLLLFLRRQSDAQCLRYAARNFLLDREHVFQLPVVAFGPDRMPGRGFH